MARVTESKGNGLVLRQMRMWIMGDGTTNAALKGSPQGRRQSELPAQGLQLITEDEGTQPRSGSLPTQMPRIQPSPWFPEQLGGPGMGFFCRASVFSETAFQALLESDLAGVTRLPAWQLLPLIPGTSGLKIAVKVTLVYREKMLKYTFWT